jgi:ketosteroid isomerase-like protein
MNQDHEAAKIIALERASLERWGRGDPSGYLELSSPDVTYFDHQTERRLDGIEALTKLYEACRGAIRIDSSEMPNPHVRFCGEIAAVLTFNFNSQGKEGAMRWNCTEVYERHAETWRIVQTHWSRTQQGR